MVCEIASTDVDVWVRQQVPVSIRDLCFQRVIVTLVVTPNVACEGFSCVFRELENAVNRAVITDFLMEIMVCYATINDITFIACKNDI